QAVKAQRSTGAVVQPKTRASKQSKKAEPPRKSVKKGSARANRIFCDLLFPRRCPCCGRTVGFAPCTQCPPLLPGVTRAPGAPVPKQGHEMQNLRCVFAPFWYAAPVSRAVWQMKFFSALEYIPFYAKKMAEALRVAGAAEYDMIVPVPTTRKEHRRRDNIPQMLARALRKTRETQRQMSLSGTQRLENVRDAYAVVAPQTVQNRRVLLADDVITTGATLNMCAKALLDAGAAVCDGVCISASEKF
ncbi:MAG: hypothetical protein RR825_07235, partial [Ruthenibacterium sp.]